ncbi:centrosome and spindle pole associated protein 1-like isoform X2 [Acanthaster planci]|uniref:Centrosome and spindle pole associated protein 1-like isoform X2 n=1 Tax=Acanthaster planci TaxID=133434 RepID=A0A8B7YB27_ACAPL|nr:centrosome and spindle pole associated protein 1-like isoform X2 [Acanthaster planci]
MAEDIDRFIQEQKSKLARERNELQQESARKVMEPSSTNYAADNNGFKENIPPTDKGVALETSKAFPLDNRDDLRSKLAKERQEEYQKFLAEKEKRSAPRAQPTIPDDGASLPIPSRDSAKDRARMARNKEYNDFLKVKGGTSTRKPRVGNEELSPAITQRPGPINPITGDAVAVTKTSNQDSRPPPDPRPVAPPQDRAADLQLRREAASQTPRPILREYDDRPPPGPPPGPRRGWGTPQPEYDEILRRKREEEARYRRYDDDFDYYPPRGGMRPSYSDPHLNKYPPEDGRYSRARYDYHDQEYDRRRVRFSDDHNPDRGYPPPGNTRYDRPPANRAPGDGRDVLSEPLGYDWNISRGGRSRTLPEMDRQRSNISRAGGNIDNNPPRAKSATLSNEEVGIAIGNRDTASATRRKKEQYRKELEQQMKETQDAKRREKQAEMRINASGANDPTKKGQGLGYAPRSASRTPVPGQQPPLQPPAAQQAGAQQAGYQPSFLNQAYPASQGPSVQPPVPALGLEEAIAKSRLGEAPMIERPFSLNNYQTTLNATSTDPYMYYGVRNPMDPDPADFANRLMQQPFPLHPLYPSPYGALPGVGKVGVPASSAPQENLSLMNASKAAQIRGESSIKNFVGDTNLSPRSLNDPKSYQAILKQQMEEKERKKRLEKEEQERYNARLEAEAAEYNPWGKGGGGAPMRDNKGKIVADLRQLHNRNEQVLNDPASTQLQLYADQSPAATTNPAAPITVNKSPRPGAPAEQPVTTTPKDPKDEYKEYLRQQVEDKKRREAALKEKIRLEEEREEKRLAQQRLQMQQDFEKEQLRMKEKEEEKKRQAEELERKIEEQKKEVEKKKHDAIEAKRREAEEDRRRQEPTKSDQMDRYSPPIPALRNKENPPRQSSPPIPTLRKKKQEEKKESPRTSKDIHGTPRRPPGEKPSDLDNHKILDNPNSKSKDNISTPWNELSPTQTPPREELKREKENPLGNLWEYSQGPTGKTSEERARIFPDKEVPEKHAQLEALDKFRLPAESPSGSPLPRVIPKDNAALSPMEKLHTHEAKDGDEADGGQDVQESQEKHSENTGKSSKFDLVDWLRSIDPDLVVYAPALAENGYKTVKTVRRMSRHTLLQFCPDMKHGHVEALLHEVERIQTPVSKKLLEEERKRNNEIRPIDLLSDPGILSDDDIHESPPGDTFTDFLIDVSKEEQEGTSKNGVDGKGRDPRDVMSALSAMRRQLHSEQQRIQSQLDRNREHGPYNSGPKVSSRRASPQVDVFEVARHKAPVTVRREPLTHHAAAVEFSSLKNRESDSRQRLREQYPTEPSSDLTLEAQQRALLKHQQEKLENMRREKSKRPLEDQMPSMNLRDLGRNDSPLLALESESAFIGINNGIADIPSTPPHRKKPPSPRRDYGEPSTSVAAQNKPKDPLGSTMSFDNDTIDYLAKKNQERNKALKHLEADNTSLVDPDDVLQRFMMKASHDRPKSGRSEDLSLWLQPTVSDY